MAENKQFEVIQLPSGNEWDICDGNNNTLYKITKGSGNAVFAITDGNGQLLGYHPTACLESAIEFCWNRMLAGR